MSTSQDRVSSKLRRYAVEGSIYNFKRNDKVYAFLDNDSYFRDEFEDNGVELIDCDLKLEAVTFNRMARNYSFIYCIEDGYYDGREVILMEEELYMLDVVPFGRVGIFKYL